MPSHKKQEKIRLKEEAKRKNENTPMNDMMGGETKKFPGKVGGKRQRIRK